MSTMGNLLIKYCDFRNIIYCQECLIFVLDLTISETDNHHHRVLFFETHKIWFLKNVCFEVQLLIKYEIVLNTYLNVRNCIYERLNHFNANKLW